MGKTTLKHLKTFESKTTKSDLVKIDSIDGFVDVVNDMEKTPQRGFSYKPGSAIKLSPETILFHSTTRENIESIIKNGFRGVGAYYSSFTKTRKSKDQISDGPFGFAFDFTNKKVDSRYQKGFLYGGWALLFRADKACRVYNTGDKQNQVVFDVTNPIDLLNVVNVKIDLSNTKEWIWDIYDTDFNLLKEEVKLKDFLKNLK